MHKTWQQQNWNTSPSMTQNCLLGEVRTYFVQYSYCGREHHCQIEAQSVEQCKAIFVRKFDNCCFIEKIQTIEDIAHEISDKLIAVVKNQLKLHFT